MLPHLPSSSGCPSWINQFFQCLLVSQVFQTTTMPHSVPCSQASSSRMLFSAQLCLDEEKMVISPNPHLAWPLAPPTWPLLHSMPLSSVYLPCHSPRPPCSAAASLALFHSIILCLSPPSKCVLSTPLYWISLYWSQTVSPICQDHFDFQPYKVLANCASPPGGTHRFYSVLSIPLCSSITI